MRDFLNSVILFLFIGVCLFSILYAAIPRAYYAAYDYEFEKTIFKNISTGNIKGNVLIGDSKPQIGLNAKCIHAVNFGLGGIGPVEGYYAERQILQNSNNHVDTLFISFSLSHLVSQGFFYRGSYFNNIISSNYLDSARRIAAQYNDNNYALKNSEFSTPIDRIIDNPALSARARVIAQFVSGGLNNTYKYLEKKHDDDMELKDSRWRIDGNNQLVNGRVIDLSTDSLVFQRTKDMAMPEEELLHKKESIVDKIYLQKMAVLAKQHGVKVIFILMPAPQSGAVYLRQKQITALQNIFRNDVIYDTITYSDIYFRDAAGHLNAAGINRFQKFLLNRMYNIK